MREASPVLGMENHPILPVELRLAAACQAAVCWLVLIGLPPVAAQSPIHERPESLGPAEIEQLDASGAAHLENAKRFLAERQWSEAVESIRRVQEMEPSRLARVEMSLPIEGFERYVTVAQYCQWRLAALATEAPEALAHYRRLVDGLAEGWLRDAEKNNDEAALLRIIQQALASSAGDDALLKLGDLALARGDVSIARGKWQQIQASSTVAAGSAGTLGVAAGSPLWLALRKFDFAGHGGELIELLRSPRTPPLGVYPDSDLDPASVQARLVIASLFEGSGERAAVELALLKLLFPAAEGSFGGRRGRYADLLESLRDQSATWELARQSEDWPTLGGNSLRGKTARQTSEMPSRLLWSYPLARLGAEHELIGFGRLRTAEDAESLCSYFPIVIEDQVLLREDGQGNSYLIALDLQTGRPLWRAEYSRGASHIGSEPAVFTDETRGVSDAHAGLPRQIGVARYTLSAQGNKLFARMGSPLSAPSSRRAARWLRKDQGFLLGVDLASEGKPLEGFPLWPPSSEWSFEGTPLFDGKALYAVVRRVLGTRSQLDLVAYELRTTPLADGQDPDETAPEYGRVKWRTRICSSGTLGAGGVDELTHLLVSQDGDRLFINTSAGTVAAVDAIDGQIQWLVKYPRSSGVVAIGEGRDKHLYRDLTPCLVWKDLVIVAPADCQRIFALDGATGQLAWALPPGEADDAICLLGVGDETLLASGDSLYFIDARSGRLLTRFPRGKLGGAEQSAPSPRGLGRGLIAGNEVWWPTRECILTFACRPVASDFGWQPRLVRELPLTPHGTMGGNLVLAKGVLLVAAGERLIALGH